MSDSYQPAISGTALDVDEIGQLGWPQRVADGLLGIPAATGYLGTGGRQDRQGNVEDNRRPREFVISLRT